ncbi:MAG: hypothetical protein WB819_13810 [Terriglobia bacterium]
MTDSEILQQEEHVRRDNQRAQRELYAQALLLQGIADHLENLVYALRNHPELLTETPPPGAQSYLEDLAILGRKSLLAECEEFRRLQERARVIEERLSTLQRGPSQSPIN